MNILKELSAKFAANQRTTVKESKAVTPIYDEEQLRALTSAIDSTAPEWLALWYHISIETGARTSDVASLRFADINLKTGQLSYVVQKQTKAARARAVRKGVEHVRKARMAHASDSEYRQLATMDAETLALSLTPEEEAIIADCVGTANCKVDSKYLSPELTKRIADYQESCFAEDDEFMFPASCSGSNRAQGLNDQPISRQTIWRKMKVFMERAEQLATDIKLHLSAYSTRKIAAYWFMKKADAEHPGSGLAIAMERLGHSSVEMTRRYLGLDRLAEALQRKLAGWAA